MRRQLAGGDCTGVTCATAWEAEVAARAGLHDDILVANEVADPGGLESLRRAAAHARITVAIDSPRHVALLRGIECAVLIEIDVGQQRCGLDPADEAAIVALAERVQATPGLTFRGLQGYEGHAVLLPERPSREEQVARAAAILNRLRTVLDCELVSGGGTGTYDLSTHLDEIQAGSYVLMDASYDKLGLPFELALACRTTIVSRHGTRAVCDAGLKALSAEYGLPRARRSRDRGDRPRRRALDAAHRRGEPAGRRRRGPADPRPHRPDGKPPRRPARRRGRRHRPALAGRG